MKYRTTVTTAGNPDHGQFAPITEPATFEADSLANLRQELWDYQAEYGIGSGNWCNPVLTVNDAAVGTFSYNLKVWNLGDGTL